MSKVVKVLSMALVIVAVLSVSVTGMVSANGESGDFDMVVSPNVLNVGSSGCWVHIHADIGYVSGEGADVTVDGNDIGGIFTFADDCGNLVVKFDIGQVKEIVCVDDVIVSAEPVFVLTYRGLSGEDTVDVIYPNIKE